MIEPRITRRNRPELVEPVDIFTQQQSDKLPFISAVESPIIPDDSVDALVAVNQALGRRVSGVEALASDNSPEVASQSIFEDRGDPTGIQSQSLNLFPKKKSRTFNTSGIFDEPNATQVKLTAVEPKREYDLFKEPQEEITPTPRMTLEELQLLAFGKPREEVTSVIPEFIRVQRDKPTSRIKKSLKALSNKLTSASIEAVVRPTNLVLGKIAVREVQPDRRTALRLARNVGILVSAYIVYKGFERSVNPVDINAFDIDYTTVADKPQKLTQVPMPKHSEILNNYRGSTWNTTTEAAYNFIKNSNPNASPSRISALFARAQEYMAQNRTA